MQLAVLSGVPYQALRWQEMEGQPFGNGVGYNGLILGDVSNLIDTEGAIAVEGSVTSNRGMSVGFGRRGQQTIPYDPFAVRFLAGGNVSIAGAQTVVGNVVGNGSFQAGLGSTYLIGKSDAPDQRQELAALYAANGSPYWMPQDDGSRWVISGYDTPRYIPAPRLSADVPAFFADARSSLLCRMQNIAALPPAGTTRWADGGVTLTGSDSLQNVFDLEWPEDGSLTGPIAIDTPEGSLSIVRIRSGKSLRITNGLWGSEARAAHTLYVLMDAQEVSMPVAAAIYGSLLAPGTVWNAHPTGGNINGNTVLAGLRVPQGSGFELHWFPFVGGMTGLGSCQPEALPEAPPQADQQPAPEVPQSPECPACPQCPVCCENGIISGIMLPSGHCQWRLKLQLLSSRQVLSVWQGCGLQPFTFEVEPEEDYLLLAETCCHYEIRLNRLCVRSLTLRG
ncbi:MAG: choice-of-anchor A family protein [Clostridiales bacterium]|nr:choice-of-anchor A family protein [Clostridiales bacterium]